MKTLRSFLLIILHKLNPIPPRRYGFEVYAYGQWMTYKTKPFRTRKRAESFRRFASAFGTSLSIRDLEAR